LVGDSATAAAVVAAPALTKKLRRGMLPSMVLSLCVDC
jgi:hypothetical protein